MACPTGNRAVSLAKFARLANTNTSQNLLVGPTYYSWNPER